MADRRTYDAGLEREALARDLRKWLDAGFWPSARADRWHRRAEKLAKAVGITYEELYRDLKSDALALRDQGDE